MPQTQYKIGTKLKDPTGKEITVQDPTQFFSESYVPISPSIENEVKIEDLTATKDAITEFVPPPLSAMTEADTYLKGVMANVKAGKNQLEDFRTKQLESIESQRKAAEEERKKYTEAEKEALDKSKQFTEPFAADLEKSERERLKVEENYFANQKSIGELEMLMNSAISEVEAMRGKTGLDVIRNPKIIKTVNDYNARIGVIQAVMSARNGQISQAYTLIDRTTAAINADRNDQLKYLDAVRSYYSGLKDDTGKKILALGEKEQKVIDAQVKSLEDEIKSSEAVANAVKEMMLADPQRVEGSGVTLNDSLKTMNKKLADYDYRQEVTEISNKMAENDYQYLSSMNEVKRYQNAGRQVVSMIDSKGVRHYYLAPPPKAGKAAKTEEENFTDDLKKMRLQIATQAVTPENAFNYLKTQYDIADEEDAILMEMLGMKPETTKKKDEKGWLPRAGEMYFGKQKGRG